MDLGARKEVFLNSVQRLLKTDIRYILRGGSWLGGGQVITTLAGFVISILFANLLPTETYGVYKYILSIGTLLTIPTLSGIDTAVSRAVAQSHEASIFQGLIVKIKWGLLATLSSLVISAYYYHQGNRIFAIAILIAGLCVPFIEAFDIYNALLNGRKMFKTFTYYNVSTQVLLTLILGTFIWFNKNIVSIIVLYFFLNVALNLLFLIITLQALRPNSIKDPNVISYGKHLSLMAIIGTMLGQLDTLLVFHYLGASELALYSISISPPEQIKGMLKNIQFLALPKFVERSKEEGKKTIFRKTFQFGILIAVMVTFYIILAPIFYSTFFPKYIDAIKYSQVLAISIIGVSLAMFLYTFLEAHGAKKQLYQYSIYSNLLNLIFLFPLIYYFGLWGAIYARVITRFVQLGMNILLVQRS